VRTRVIGRDGVHASVECPTRWFLAQRRVVLGLKEPHPHVMGMVVDDEQPAVESMWGGDINTKGHVEKGTGGLRTSNSVAWCSTGLMEQA
jgi:hypothetical protein